MRRRRRADGRPADPAARGRVRRHQGRRHRAGGTSPTRSPAAATTTPVPLAAAQGRRPAARRRPALLGHPGGAEDLPRDPALHGHGPGRRRRRRARRRQGHPRPRRRPAPTSSRGCASQGADPGDVPSVNATIDAPVVEHEHRVDDRHQTRARRR